MTLTLLLLAVYAAITVVLGVVVGGDSAWVVALATLVVALAFRPLRSRVQDLVDRRYRRARYEGVRLVRTFEDDVRDGVRAPEEIGVVLAEALQDPLAEIFFWIPETGGYADTTGESLAGLPHDERARRELSRDDIKTASLLHDPTLLERRDLLDGVLAAASLSIEMARLRVEVRIQLAEVEASRARIVEAGYEERRRLERDLHDGAQQRLVSLGVQVRRLQLSLPAKREFSRLRSIRSLRRSERRFPTSGRSPPAFDRLGSTRGLQRPCATWREPRLFPSTSRQPASGRPRASRLLRTSSRARR